MKTRIAASLALLLAAPSLRAGVIAKFAAGPNRTATAQLTSADGYHYADFVVAGKKETWFKDGRSLGPLPAGTCLAALVQPAAALSPDGRRLAVAQKIWTAPLDWIG